MNRNELFSKYIQENEITTARQIITHIYNQLDKLEAELDEHNDAPVRLNRNEAALLRYLCQGYTLEKIGTLLGKKKRTIQNYIVALQERCGVSSRTELIKWALKYGYCTVETVSGEK